MFNIFKRRKKLSLKELYAPVLDEMWCCVINFCPWKPDRHRVVFKKVNIIKAEAATEGIWVQSDFQNPYEKYHEDFVSGYIDKITMRMQTSGFFETRELAEKAYNALMEEWIAVIRNGMVNTGERTHG